MSVSLTEVAEFFSGMEITYQWDRLGYKLRVTEEQINDIKRHFRNPVDCLHAMLSEWLAYHPHPIWSTLSDALFKVDEDYLARQGKLYTC